MVVRRRLSRGLAFGLTTASDSPLVLFEFRLSRTLRQGYLSLSWCLTAVSTARAFYSGGSRPP